MIQVQKATKQDLGWINEQYQQIGFVPSDLETDTVFLAILDDEYVGLGRIVKYDEHHYELGGIYTVEKHRGMNVASYVVSRLVEYVRSAGIEHVYCIPFEKLTLFYEKFGFHDVEELGAVPKQIADKYYWCLKQYEERVVLKKLAL
ncbi:GNAT family N-acetyltransferase [Paenibacillus aestuarii]|uniref:GNAT family N-acetyltransferase n=1 Tax=Paenibacillus aestuarii TaxID=516965 RepID=A0ABW0KHV8_9BACL|nr:GNAT family N-acetyltransferase [Paenibacillus aestuarii]